MIKKAIFILMLIILILALTSIPGAAEKTASAAIAEKVIINATVIEAIEMTPETPYPTKKEPGFESLFALISLLAIANLVSDKGRR